MAATLTASLGVAAVATTQSASAADSAAEEVPSYAMGIPGRTWTIDKPTLCGPGIGDGGNLIENGRTYEGKCQGAGQEPTITGTVDGASDERALTFRTKYDFEYQDAVLQNAEMNTWVGPDGKRLRDRTELATPGRTLPFHTNVWVGFDIRIPYGVDDVTGSGAFVMQLWQCHAGPIAGVRIQSGAGNGHNLQFVRRGDEPGVDYDTAMATKPLVPNEWHSFVIKYNVERYQPGGPKGLIEVWHRKVGATTTETKILEQETYFGFGPDNCDNNSFQEMFRIKYGMYKDYQPGATFRADYRNVRIGASKKEVQPYYRD
ncbi:heparin lyase I family protein [Promicromonospora sp. NPDC059942]|uniref:heparin lyase I family protein n=1 Tax=Promicromonospora sp. NPDC059942 TaxID=3347009 RepID=UPI00366A513C